MSVFQGHKSSSAESRFDFWEQPEVIWSRGLGDKTVIAFSRRQKEQVESNEITFCEIFGWMTKRKIPE